MSNEAYPKADGCLAFFGMLALLLMLAWLTATEIDTLKQRVSDLEKVCVSK